MRVRYSKVVALSMGLVFLLSVAAGCGAGPSQSAKPAQPAQGEPQRSVTASQGVVAAAHPLAAQTGLEVLKKGGNAVDAAIATAFALGVVEPAMSGLGGGGYAIVYIAKEKKTYVVDYREMAPAQATPDMYKLDDKGKVVNRASTVGYKAALVPGQLAGMEMLHKKFGSRPWAELVQPAIRLSEEGIIVSRVLAGIIDGQFEVMQKFPSLDFFKRVWMKDDMPLAVGSKVVNRELTESLKKVAASGAAVFYKGEIAEAIAKEFAKPGGENWITKEDLAGYRAILREPVQGTYRGYRIISTGPSTSGGAALLAILNILEGYDLAKMGPGSADYYHVAIEAQRLAIADRQEHMGDPAFVDVPLSGLISKQYAQEQRKRIDPQKASGIIKPGDPSGYGQGSTTSFCVADKEGNMISITQSINLWFGSGVVPAGTGIMLGNHGDDFHKKPGLKNSPGPNKRPLSMTTSTIVLKDGKPFMVLGSPGGLRIITAVAEVITNVIDFKMELLPAIAAPRFHQQNEKQTRIEARIPADVRKALEARGHAFSVRGEMDLHFGGVHAIMIDPKTNKMTGAADPRRDGVAVGY